MFIEKETDLTEEEEDQYTVRTIKAVDIDFVEKTTISTRQLERSNFCVVEESRDS